MNDWDKYTTYTTYPSCVSGHPGTTRGPTTKSSSTPLEGTVRAEKTPEPVPSPKKHRLRAIKRALIAAWNIRIELGNKGPDKEV